MAYSVLVGDSLEFLKGFPDDSIDCCVTSPPYYGLRNYGVDGQIGLEATPDDYVDKLVAVFHEVKRLLKPQGTLWLNIGDSYASSGSVGNSSKDGYNDGRANRDKRLRAGRADGVKPKDLLGIPWMVAFALRADGWYLRQDIIWHKPNPMPESVTDRCTRAHEYLFMLSKSKSYYYDYLAAREPSVQPSRAGKLEKVFSSSDSTCTLRQDTGRAVMRTAFRNPRDVWSIPTQPYKGAHFATFPIKLIAPCVKAGCPEKVCANCGIPYERKIEKNASTRTRASGAGQDSEEGMAGRAGEVELVDGGLEKQCTCTATEFVSGVVLDPFGGSGTTAGVAESLGRNAILLELNPEYAALMDERVKFIVDKSKPEA